VTEAPVRVRCARCGPRLVPLACVRVLSRAAGAEYVFTCPECHTRVRRPADARMIAVLREAGALSLTVHSLDVRPDER
jgi:RNase P subunit RPR2